MAAADDRRRRGEATGTISARFCRNDEASGAHALGQHQRSATGPTYNALFHSTSHQQPAVVSSHHLPSHNHRQLALLGPPSRFHQALASSTCSVAPDFDLGSCNGSDTRGASSWLPPTAHNSLSRQVPDDEGQRAIPGLHSSSKPTLAFAVVQQHQTGFFSSALTPPSSLAGGPFGDVAGSSSASHLPLVTSSGHNQTDQFPLNQELVRMAVAANAVAPQGLSSESFYAHHLSDHLPTKHADADLPILNAQQYDLMASSGTSKTKATQKAARTTTGKRSRATDHADGAGEEADDLDEDEGRRKRSRGRPRLDTKDETAADRRRTQIRLAQRAYRNRKDTAITTLEQKVKDLEEANESMSKGFNDFYETLMAESMLDSAPHAARLRSIADKFRASTSIAKDRTIGSSESQSSDACDHVLSQPLRRDTAGSSSSSSEKQTPSFIARPQQAFLMGGEGNASTVSPTIHMPSSLSHEIVTQATPDNASFPFYASMEQGTQKYMAQLSDPTSYRTVPAPASYAAYEVTFGRRFQRANLEAGLRLISMPNPPPERYAAVFGFCLFFESREKIIQRLSSSLRKTQQETLSYWRAPFTNLGGAGTFFMGENVGTISSPDSSENGSLPIGNQGTLEYGKPQEYTGFSMGPFSAEVETTRDERLDHRLRMIHPGFEGDFFDADEVETYLRRLGITIPQSADFVEAEINVADLEVETTPLSQGSNVVGAGPQGTYTATGLISPDSGYGNFTGPDASAIWLSGSSDTGQHDSRTASADMAMTMQSMAPVFNAGLMSAAPDLNDDLAAFMYHPGLLDSVWATAPIVQRSKISIDVNMLVTELVRNSVCLGRSPGVRRRDVNKSVKRAAGLLSA